MSKQVKLSPELQEIFDKIPAIIEYCEREAIDYSANELSKIEQEINLAPDESDKIIRLHRDRAILKYNELINSGLRLIPTDKTEILQLIGGWMIAKNTWQIPLPKDCSFSSIKPDPLMHIHAAIYPVYYQYNLIQACNELLIPTSKTPPNGIDEESKGKIKMPEAALILIYRNVTLKDPRTDPEQKAKIWAERFGFDNLGSGDVLFRKWQSLSKKNGITGFDETQVQKIKNMIKRIEKITPYLRKPEQQERAAIDIQKLQMKLN
ncbi:MAG: hypothetical protein H6541_10050 [Lentimicrobiaceae bacterium]|nr:hypothetical protein [Lentimicrobiaceae bacterium]MCO5266823.1 hypothetical protein [Lentimicrobium sp.]